MNQPQKISITNIIFINTNSRAPTTIPGVKQVSGSYEHAQFFNWVNFSHSGQQKRITNNAHEKLRLQFESIEAAIRFISSLNKVNVIKFTTKTKSSGQFNLTKNTKILSQNNSVILENTTTKRVHDVLGENVTSPMTSPIQLLFTNKREEFMADNRDDALFDFFKRGSKKEEVNQFTPPFLWFDGKHFHQENHRNATQFVIECESNKWAQELLSIINDKIYLNLEINTVANNGFVLPLPVIHAYLEDENTVVATSLLD